MSNEQEVDIQETLVEGPEYAGLEFKRYLKVDHELPTVTHLINEYLPGTNKPLATPDNKPHKVSWTWSEFFPNEKPIEVEIGSGKGGFLVNYANAHPEMNILGSEWDTKWGRYAGDRLHRNQIQNTRMMRGDVFYFLRDFVPSDTVKAFHMYFPDPWPKAHHRRRRLLRPDFLNEVHRVIIAGPEALFHWGTDYEEYNTSARETMLETGFMELVTDDAPPTDGIMTNFEKKYRIEGRPIYRSVWRIIK